MPAYGVGLQRMQNQCLRLSLIMLWCSEVALSQSNGIYYHVGCLFSYRWIKFQEYVASGSFHSSTVLQKHYRTCQGEMKDLGTSPSLPGLL